MNSASMMDSLPDDILIHILSFLPTKKAASTSILSRRWKTLFAFTHNFEVDDGWDHIGKTFRDFVYRTLALQAGSHVKKLSLKHESYCKKDVIVVFNHWLNYALKHGVSELNLCIRTYFCYAVKGTSHIHICIDKDMCFLQRVFKSTTLVKLSLGRSFIIDDSLPSDTYLPSLKVLLLDRIGFNHDQLSNVFLAGCPVLEDLTIYFLDYGADTYIIASKTIKKLSFTNEYFSLSRIFSFDMPSVVDLYYSDCAQIKSQYYHFDSLVKATLDLRYRFHYISEQDREGLKNLIARIRNVKTLDLNKSAAEVISSCYKYGLPMFNNLVVLVFSSRKTGWRVLLPRLLERSPNLKVLVLSDLHRHRFTKRRFVGIQTPLENKIEMLSITEYQGTANELRHISHFLLNMKCLKVLKIYVAEDLKKMQVTKDLMKLPTVSSELKIQVM